MATHTFRPEVFHNVLGGRSPVLSIRSGDTVVTSTVDAAGVDKDGRAVAEPPNPLTGPFYVEDAKPGDCLEVRIDSLTPNRLRCWTRRFLSPNVLDPDALRDLGALADRENPPHIDWQIDPAGKTVSPVSSGMTGRELRVPLAPMLGCLGTAPPYNQAISNATSGPNGGNMDWVGVNQGMTLFFPVFEDGALFALGDGHATQGHGEIAGTGTEVSMDVSFSVKLHKRRETGWPRAEDQHSIYTIGNARPLDQALQHATTEMVRWLRGDWSLTLEYIGYLMAQTVAYHIGNVFDPAYTVVCEMDKRYLK